jgi:FkbM family methyltransferase
MRLALSHFVYAPTLAERFDLYFNDLVPAEIDGEKVLDYSRPGILQTYLQSGLEFQMASFPEELAAIEDYFHWYRPKVGDTVFDVGAHCGVSSYYFAKLVGSSGRVVAFEPDPVNFSLLLLNIERHKLDNVLPLQIAIAADRGEASFSSEGTIGSVLTRNSSRASVGNVIRVKTVTLEDAFRKWGPPQFCKIDIEGSEIEVIHSAGDFLKLHQSHCEFAIDTNHLVDGSFTDTRIETLFREVGYESASTSSALKTTWARPLPTP